MARLAIHISLAAGILALATMAPGLAQVPPYQFTAGQETQKLQQDQDIVSRYQGYADNMREDLAQWRTYRSYALGRMHTLKTAGQEHSDEYQTLSRWMQQEEQDEPLVNQKLQNMELWISHYRAESETERWNLHQDQEASQQAAAGEQQRQQEAAWHTQLDQLSAQHDANDWGNYGGYGGYYHGGHGHWGGGHISMGHFHGGGGGGGHAYRHR